MSSNGLYYNNRYYPIFEPGDEVYTEVLRFNNVVPLKIYLVVSCERHIDYDSLSVSVLVEVVGEDGRLSKYPSCNFNKSPSQVREDKLNDILGY